MSSRNQERRSPNRKQYRFFLVLPSLDHRIAQRKSYPICPVHCWRENLRIVTHAQNMRNSRKYRNGRLPGTSFIKKSKKWNAVVRKKYIGQFNTEKEAYAACVKNGINK